MISACIAVGLLGLAASASAHLITNGDFEDDLGVTVGSGVANFAPGASTWFDKNGTSAGDGDFIQWDDANVNVPDDADGEVWGGLSSNGSAVRGAFYQAIGTYVDTLDVTISFNVGDRSNFDFPTIQVNLYSGNVTGADGSSLTGLGATLLTSSADITDTGLGFDGTDGSTHTASVAPFVLNTGTGGTPGDTLWLEITTTDALGGTHQALIDDVVASNDVVTWTGSSDAVSLFELGNWDDPGGVIGVSNFKGVPVPHDFVVNDSGATVGGAGGVSGTLDLDGTGTLTVSSGSIKLAAGAIIEDGSVSIIGNATGSIQGTLNNADLWMSGGLSLLGSLDLLNGSSVEATWFAFGGVCDFDGGSTLTIREDATGTYNGTTVNFLDTDSKIVYSNLSRTVAEVVDEHLSSFKVNGQSAVQGGNVIVYTDPDTGYTTVHATAGTLIMLR